MNPVELAAGVTIAVVIGLVVSYFTFETFRDAVQDLLGNIGVFLFTFLAILVIAVVLGVLGKFIGDRIGGEGIGNVAAIASGLVGAVIGVLVYRSRDF